MAKHPVETKKSQGLEARLKPTTLNHIFYLDVEGDGKLREVAVTKMVKNQDGAIQELRYIDIALLDQVDKGRLKALVTNVHANKYELWDLMSQNQLNNGKNALDYFHQLTRIVRGPGAVNTALGGGLAGVRAESSQVIGAEFSPPDSGVLDPGAPA